MEPSEPRIEIFAPFGEAFETTASILTRPFDLGKWFVIGFAAWLATMFGGFSFNFRSGYNKGDWNWTANTSGNLSLEGMPHWVIPLLVFAVFLGLGLGLLLLWLNSRGRFMFTDCIVRNRGAIAEPWREYRPEGSSYFYLQLVIMIGSILVISALAVLFLLGWRWKHSILPLPIIILLGVTFLLIALVVGLIMKFVVPVMYRQRCGSVEAFGAIWRLIVANPGVFILFGLFYLLLYIAAGLLGWLACCFTCCLAALPYIGTVILLPLVMFLFTYPLCFIRQFGDSYDVWAVVRPAELLAADPTVPPPPPSAPFAPPIPPVQEPPAP